MKLPSKVKIREVGPRDGFQSLKNFLPTEKKLKIIEALIQAGVNNIEATSFVSPKAVPQLKDAMYLMALVPRNDVTYSVLVPNLKGAQDAIASNADELVVVISASETHNQKNIHRTIGESLGDLEPIFKLSKEKCIPIIGAISVSFGCPYEGNVPEKHVFRIVESCLSRGASSIILADTTGMATPIRVHDIVRQFLSQYPETELSLHFHNNRGTAIANLLTSLMEGVTTFDTSLGGIGGCPYVPQASGNLPTEDVVFMLEDMGVSTGIDLEKLIEAAELLENFLGHTLPGQVMKSGPRK